MESKFIERGGQAMVRSQVGDSASKNEDWAVGIDIVLTTEEQGVSHRTMFVVRCWMF